MLGISLLSTQECQIIRIGETLKKMISVWDPLLLIQLIYHQMMITVIYCQPTWWWSPPNPIQQLLYQPHPRSVTNNNWLDSSFHLFPETYTLTSTIIQHSKHNRYKEARTTHCCCATWHCNRTRHIVPLKFWEDGSHYEDNHQFSTITEATEHDLHKIVNRYLNLQDITQTYATLHCNLGISDNHNVMMFEVVINILKQYHMSKRLKIFGNDCVWVLLKEFKQSHNIMVMEPVNSRQLISTYNDTALQYLMLLKRKDVKNKEKRLCR